MATQLINTRYEILETSAVIDSQPFLISKARDLVGDRIVTLEMLPAQMPGVTVAFRDVFRAAAQQAVRLDHANITRVYDCGETEGAQDLYVASEYLRGITLKERIRRVAPFSLTVTADIAVAIAEALDYAHQVGVVHGDLQPRSVLLSPEGQIKVMDFAYARIADPVDLTAYPSAPEAGPATLPASTEDLYRLGVILYEMLTGALPAQDAAGPPSPRSLNPGVPPALEGVVQKALQPDPLLRYRTAASMLADLRAVRDALHSGRSLAWTPAPEKRAPRPPADQTVIAHRPAELIPEEPAVAARPGAITAAAEEMEDERYMRREPKRFNVLGLLLTILFIAAIVGVIGLSWYATRFLAIPNDVVVPSLIGKTFDDAQRVADAQHFTLTEGGTDYSDKWTENQIYQQDPTPGRAIKSGQEVKVWRSLGPRLLRVPDLVGMTQDRAQRALQDASLPAGSSTQDYSDKVQPGIVMSQTPEPGKVPRDTIVNFVVSKGKQPPDAPTGVQADATAPDTVEVHWDAAPRADSYTLFRSLNGASVTVAKNITGTHFTDKSLTPNTEYIYTVSAANAAGNSGPSDIADVVTPAPVTAPPVIGPNVKLTPSDTGATPDASGTSGPPAAADSTPARMRQFTIAFRVPRHPRSAQHHVQFEVQDTTGTNMVYDEMRDPGDQVQAPITAFGNKVTFFIFLDGKLVRRTTL